MTKQRTPTRSSKTSRHNNKGASTDTRRRYPEGSRARSSDRQHNKAEYSEGDRVDNQMRQALELWQEWLAQPNWYQLDRWLKNTLGKNRKYGKRDRLFYGDILFNAARFGYWAAIVIECKLAEGSKPSDVIGAFSSNTPSAKALKEHLHDISENTKAPDFLALCQWRAMMQKPLPSALSDYQMAIDALHNFSDASLEGKLVWHGIPVCYAEQLQAFASATSADSMNAFLTAQDTRPPLWLRLNHADKKHPVIGELAEFYTLTEDGQSLAIGGDRGIFGMECYKNGWVEIQDWASQQLALKVAATPGQKVWDACAGGGGKTLAIAAPLNNKGAVWATDIREHKLIEVKRRAKQAEFYNIRTAPWNGEAPLRLPKEIANDGGFDWVLVDGPCSSSGTWRRNPDAKLRNMAEDLTSLTALQLQLLTQASQSVKKGGKLVYGTCSFFTEENTGIVERFLAAQTGWQLISAELIGCPNKNSDTLFAAVLAKTA